MLNYSFCYILVTFSILYVIQFVFACNDVSTSACQEFATQNPAMCDDGSCYATLCPRTCHKCGKKKRTVVKVWRFLLPLLLLFYQNNLRFYHWIWFSGITTSWYITFAYKNIRLSITYKWRPSDINTQMWFTYCLFMVFFTLSQLKRNTWALISILITTSTFKIICIIE